MHADIAADAPELPAVSQLPQPALADAPPLPEVLRAGVGFAAIGACAGLGSWSLVEVVRTAPTGLVIALAPLFLTTPALLVVHQFAGLASPPERVIGAVARGVADAGRLALGLAPTVLFFAATSDLAMVVYVLCIAGVGLRCVGGVAWALIAAEREAVARVADTAQMQVVAMSWALLTTLVGLRVAADAILYATFGLD